jgi:hypothetical protein
MAAVGSGDYFDSEVASEVLRKAHGLLGTMTHLLDLMGVDVVREIEFPEYRRNFNSEASRESIAEFIAVQTAISSRYGHYPLYRVMFEDNPEKREAMLGAPVVDPTAPAGEILGSWVLRGPGIDVLDISLYDLDRFLEPQEDGMHFAEFSVDVVVQHATRRETVVAALARLGRFKRLQPTPEATSLFHALTGSVYDVAAAMNVLGTEDTERRILLDEVRLALSALHPSRLLSAAKKPALSKVLHALLNAPGRLSTRELATWAGVSTESARTYVKQLVAAGLADVEETGAGKANWYRICLPSKTERHAPDAPIPVFVDDDHQLAFGGWLLHDAAELFLEEFDEYPQLEHPDLWGDIIEGEATLGALVEHYPRIEPWIEVFVALIDERATDGSRTSRAPPGPRRLAFELGAEPVAMQSRLGGPPAAGGIWAVHPADAAADGGSDGPPPG